MKKNKMMRLASVLLIAVILTTCAISGTFAKYTTSVDATDEARVAKWGFTAASIEIDNLFKTAYDQHVNGAVDVIAPGTTNSDKFQFVYGGQSGINAPEVAYEFKVSTEGSSCDDAIKNNPNILWQLDENGWGSWDAMIAGIKALAGEASGTKTYEANQLPAAFTISNNEHKIAWKWIFDENASDKEDDTVNNDVNDTAMGNKDTLDKVVVKITITATQID